MLRWDTLECGVGSENMLVVEVESTGVILTGLIDDILRRKSPVLTTAPKLAVRKLYGWN